MRDAILDCAKFRQSVVVGVDSYLNNKNQRGFASGPRGLKRAQNVRRILLTLDAVADFQSIVALLLSVSKTSGEHLFEAIATQIITENLENQWGYGNGPVVSSALIKDNVLGAAIRVSQFRWLTRGGELYECRSVPCFKALLNKIYQLGSKKERDAVDLAVGSYDKLIDPPSKLSESIAALFRPKVQLSQAPAEEKMSAHTI